MESKYKAELGRVRKKYEQQFIEYETQTDTLARSNGELARANKALAARIKVTAHVDVLVRIVNLPYMLERYKPSNS